MNMLVFSIYDRVAQVYGDPFLAVNCDQAVRGFQCDYQRAVEQAPASPFAKYIEDYELHWIGSFDSSTGKLEPEKCSGVIYFGRNLLNMSDDN